MGNSPLIQRWCGGGWGGDGEKRLSAKAKGARSGAESSVVVRSRWMDGCRAAEKPSERIHIILNSRGVSIWKAISIPERMCDVLGIFLLKGSRSYKNPPNSTYIYVQTTQRGDRGQRASDYHFLVIDGCTPNYVLV